MLTPKIRHITVSAGLVVDCGITEYIEGSVTRQSATRVGAHCPAVVASQAAIVVSAFRVRPGNSRYVPKSLLWRSLEMSGSYVHWGVIQISVANLVVIGIMLVVFVAAITVPFSRPRRDRERGDTS
jgi:hypothetical protein